MDAPEWPYDDFAHLLAYGNSDQASFRSPEVRSSFSVMSVPGTIASYYDEATAAFVLSSQIPYVIDPRTPLFQGRLDSPRASHRTLAKWHGQRVADHVPVGVTEVTFESGFWDQPTVAEMVHSVLSAQRSYGTKAAAVASKIDRYERLLAEAMALEGASPPPTLVEGEAPGALLAPYFAVTGRSDPWWSVLERVWQECLRQPDAAEVRPVLCVGPRIGEDVPAVAVLDELVGHIPSGLYNSCLFWITGFDERQVTVEELRRLTQIVSTWGTQKNLVNLYGGYFSICLQRKGLRGFGNGLTYSESRAWPALASTGAAPARYYVPDLHMFLPQASAAQLIAAAPSLACNCSACEQNESVAGMPYHDLKKHFALARRREITTVRGTPPSLLAEQMRDAYAALEAARPNLPPRAGPDATHLVRWAQVVAEF